MDMVTDLTTPGKRPISQQCQPVEREVTVVWTAPLISTAGIPDIISVALLSTGRS